MAMWLDDTISYLLGYHARHPFHCPQCAYSGFHVPMELRLNRVMFEDGDALLVCPRCKLVFEASGSDVLEVVSKVYRRTILAGRRLDEKKRKGGGVC